MQKRILILAFCLCIIPLVVHAQTHFQVCCTYAEAKQSPSVASPAFYMDAGAEKILWHITKYSGLPPNFELLSADSLTCPNAAAVIYFDSLKKEYRRYILYNPKFMEYVKKVTRSDWASMSVLLHEAGHHLSGHTLVTGGSKPNKEIEADKFSGFVLYNMGASLKDAQIALRTIAQEEDTDTHPGKQKRLAAIAEGWMQAKLLDRSGKVKRTVQH